MAATEAMTVPVRQHKAWTWTWARTPVFSFKVPTTRSTIYLSCSDFSRLSTIALKTFAFCIP